MGRYIWLHASSDILNPELYRDYGFLVFRHTVVLRDRQSETKIWKCPVSKSFTVGIQRLSTDLIKPIFLAFIQRLA